MNVVDEKSTTTCLPPWAITSSSCCLNSGAVYRSTSPASEITYASSRSCSVLMSKFIGLPRSAANCSGRSLTRGRGRRSSELLQALLDLRGERIVGRERQEPLVRDHRLRRRAGGVGDLPELELGARGRRVDPRAPLVDLQQLRLEDVRLRLQLG